MKKLCFIVVLFGSSLLGTAQSETTLIEKVLNDYLEGTSKAKPDQVRQAFHPDLNLYSVDENDKLKVWKGSDYISGFEGKEPSNRLGKILSIDIENNAAMAKAEISYPNRPLVFVDYFMLLKVEGEWTIIHKMYTKKHTNYAITFGNTSGFLHYNNHKICQNDSRTINICSRQLHTKLPDSTLLS